MPSRTDTIGPVDLEDSTTTYEIEIPSGCDEVRFQSRVTDGSWTTAEIAVEWSLTGGGDDDRWPELDEPLTLTVANVGTLSTPRYLGSVRLVRFRVDVDQGGDAGEAEIVVSSDSSGLGALRWRAAS